MTNWRTVVEPAPADLADAAFELWQTENNEIYRSLAPEQILRDLIRGCSGELVRYRIQHADQEEG